MPSILIEVRRPLSDHQASELIEAVLLAVSEAFQLPPNDRNVRVVEHRPERWAVPPEIEHSERFVQVTVDAFSGRSLDAKRKLHRLVVEQLERLDVPRDHVRTLLRESPRENWGIRGGQAACDVDLGFKVDV